MPSDHPTLREQGNSGPASRSEFPAYPAVSSEKGISRQGSGLTGPTRQATFWIAVALADEKAGCQGSSTLSSGKFEDGADRLLLLDGFRQCLPQFDRGLHREMSCPIS